MNSYLELQQALAVIIFAFCCTVGVVLVSFIILKKRLDKVVSKKEEDYQNSLKILSEVQTTDKGCDIEKVFSELEENNIDISCNKELDRGV